MDGLSPNQFKGVRMNDIPVVEDLLLSLFCFTTWILQMETLMASMQKRIAFYHDKDIDIVKLGSTLPNPSNKSRQIYRWKILSLQGGR